MPKAGIYAIVVALIIGALAFCLAYLGLKLTGHKKNFRPALQFGLYFAIAIAAITIPVFSITAAKP